MLGLSQPAIRSWEDRYGLIVAEQGFAEFSLEQLAERADVTRNNLYRYLPRGRPDIAAAMVREAGRELLAGG